MKNFNIKPFCDKVLQSVEKKLYVDKLNACTYLDLLLFQVLVFS